MLVYFVMTCRNRNTKHKLTCVDRYLWPRYHPWIRSANWCCPSKHSSMASPLPFSSPLTFFLDFWWNFRAQMRREGGVGSYIRGVTPVARGGATGPPFFQGSRCKFEEKKLHLGHVDRG